MRESCANLVTYFALTKSSWKGKASKTDTLHTQFDSASVQSHKFAAFGNGVRDIFDFEHLRRHRTQKSEANRHASGPMSRGEKSKRCTS